jgi:arginase
MPLPVSLTDDMSTRSEKGLKPDAHKEAHTPAAKPSASVAVLGIPNDENSSFLRGAAGAPVRIRAAFQSPSTNKSTENGIDLGERTDWQDYGDLDFSAGGDAFGLIEQRVGELLDAGHKLLSLGGDHAITYPILRAYAKQYPRLHILHFDAHPDLYDELDGNRHSHACPFARIMEEKLASSLLQVGIRTMNPHQQAQAERFGVNVVDMRSIPPDMVIEFTEPLYISLDLDVLDPAFAPGISHYEPGGLSTRELLRILQSVKGEIVGADLVEYNPERDPQGITAMVAAKLFKELLARILEES